MEAGGVELQSGIGNTQLTDFQCRTNRTKLTERIISVRRLYTTILWRERKKPGQRTPQDARRSRLRLARCHTRHVLFDALVGPLHLGERLD